MLERMAGDSAGSYLGPFGDAAEMCAATPTLVTETGDFPLGPMVTALQIAH